MATEGTTFEAIGTVWRIGLGLPQPTTHLGRAVDPTTLAAVLARVEQFDRDWSRFRDDGRVARMSRTAGTHVLPADARPLFDLYRELYTRTSGRLSPLVGRSLEHLGYDPTYRLQAHGDPLPAPRWEDAITLRETVDGLTLEAAVPLVIDIGAAGKGYLVDLVGEVLAQCGETDAVVEAGGDARVFGRRSIRVALEHPADAARAVGVVDLHDSAIAASSPNRRAWGPGLHHIIDAVTGAPTHDDTVASWVIAPTALLADALATALFLADPVEVTSDFDAEWAMMSRTGTWRSSAGWPGEFFTKGATA